MAFFDLFDDRQKFLFLGSIHHIGIILSDHLTIGRHDVDIEVVDLGELGGFRVGCPGHAA